MTTDKREPWWRRLRTWLFGVRREPEAEPGPITVPPPPADAPPPPRRRNAVELHGNDEFTFTTPAQDDAFEFTVSVRCDWCAEKISSPDKPAKHKAEEELRTELDRARTNLRVRVEDEVRRKAREFQAHRPAALEDELGPHLERCFGNGDVRCTVTIRVTPAAEVMEALRPHAIQRLDLDLVSDLSVAQAARMADLQNAWQRFLEDCLGPYLRREAPEGPVRSWLAPFAAELAADPSQAASVVRTMLDARTHQAADLLHRLNEGIEDHHQLGTYEFVLQYDSALRAILELLGVQVPESRGVPPWTAGALG